MAKSACLEGQTFDRLTVVDWRKKEGWFCICECGKSRLVSTEHLKSGRVKSCGCLLKDRQIYIGFGNQLTLTSYLSMLQRTNNLTYDAASDEKFQPYQTENRKVCERWLEPDGIGYRNFCEDMGLRPVGHTIERIDNNDGYFPENCKWETAGKQCYNRKQFSNNSTGRTGVYLREDTGRWRVKISVEGRTISLGEFDVFEDACKAREAAEIKYYGKVKE